MKKRRLVCVVMASALLLVASSVIGSDEAPKPRPFWGKLKGEVTWLPSDVCPGVTGVPVQTVTESEGRMTHLGRTKKSTSHCSTVDGSAAVNGMATFTAANGDEVWTTYTAATVAWPSPPEMLIIQEVEYTVVGGTGRFEGASGFLNGMVYVTYEGYDDPSWPIEFVFAGMISY